MTQFKTFPLMLLIGLISLCSCDSCSDEIDTTVLPPETQSGEHTFGCYVNDELFVNACKCIRAADASYIRQSNQLLIFSEAKTGEFINIKVINPSLNPSKLDLAYFVPLFNSAKCFTFAGINFGTIILTKFDTINKIVSGRFEFPGQCSSLNFNSTLDTLYFTGDSIVNITQGRFDLPLGIYDN